MPDGVLARLPDHVEYWSVVSTARSLVLADRREALLGLLALEVTREPGRDGTRGISSIGESNFATNSLMEEVLCRVAVVIAGVDLEASIEPLREALRLDVRPFERTL